MYRLFFNLLLRRLDAERAHGLAIRALRLLRATGAGRALLGRLVGAPDEKLRVHALGLTFPSPLGAAAGLDKEASWFEDLEALGFGFVEVGTITPSAQPGKPRPRIARALSERAIVNKLGFPNPGAKAAAARLRRRARSTIVGVNIGKSATSSLEAAAGDYRVCARELGPVADYLAINVSSPNTPGLRDLQAADALRALVGAVRSGLREAGVEVPLLIKIAPDLDDDQLDALAALALELGLEGIIATNTTTARLGLDDRVVPFEGGGVSGPPLRRRSLGVLERLRATVGDRLVLISVGGIEDADDIWHRLLTGATLVQAYTGFVYGGPGWPRQMNQELARRLRDSGASSIEELVGAGPGPPLRTSSPV